MNRNSIEHINTLSKYLREKYISGESEGHEIIVALVAMSKAGKVDDSSIPNILMNVFLGNPEGVLRALNRAKELIDDEMVNDIINEVTNK